MSVLMQSGTQHVSKLVFLSPEILHFLRWHFARSGGHLTVCYTLSKAWSSFSYVCWIHFGFYHFGYYAVGEDSGWNVIVKNMTYALLKNSLSIQCNSAFRRVFVYRAHPPSIWMEAAALCRQRNKEAVREVALMSMRILIEWLFCAVKYITFFRFRFIVIHTVVSWILYNEVIFTRTAFYDKNSWCGCMYSQNVNCVVDSSEQHQNILALVIV